MLMLSAAVFALVTVGLWVVVLASQGDNSQTCVHPFRACDP